MRRPASQPTVGGLPFRIVSGHVAWISIAPVKALALVDRDAVDLTEYGVADNRRFHLIDERGVMVNGKRMGTLATVRPEYDDAAGTLALTFPDGTTVADEVALGDPVASVFFGHPRQGRLVHGPFAQALSEFAGRPLRLIRSERAGLGVDRGRGGAMSMVSEAALGDFDRRRFRMLFGIGGVEAHAEDDWIGYRVRIGDAVVRPLSETGRCLITSQHPDTGRPDFDMLEWIRANRPEGGGEPLPFGVHGSVAEAGTVRIGDPVERL
jgi:uncharacterized protein YcbX